MRTESQCVIKGKTVEVELTRGYVAIVDLADLETVKGYCWQARISHVGKTLLVYASRKAGNKTVWMHRATLKPKANKLVDHKDGNGLNNRRKNLREATRSQNNRNRGVCLRNKSGHVGVSWNTQMGMWRADLTVDGKRKFLGLFKTVPAAVSARAKAGKKYHGEFSRKNSL